MSFVMRHKGLWICISIVVGAVVLVIVPAVQKVRDAAQRTVIT